MEFTQYATGNRMSPGEIAGLAHQYAGQVTYTEPRAGGKLLTEILLALMSRNLYNYVDAPPDMPYQD